MCYSYIRTDSLYLQVAATFFPGNVNQDYAQSWGNEEFVRWIVDRFHYLGHARTDNVCRDHSSPMNPYRRGMVRVLFIEDVPEGEEVDEDEEDEFGKVTYIANPDNIPEGERPAI